jgi:uncharacterized protein
MLGIRDERQDPDMTDPAAPQQPPQQPQPVAAAPFTDAEDKQYTVLATFLNIILLIPALIFFLGFKDRGRRLAVQSKENLNWSIGITIVVVGAAILSGIIGLIPFVGWIIGLLLGLVGWAAWILNIIFSIVGGVKLSGDQAVNYTYPFSIKFIK